MKIYINDLHQIVGLRVRPDWDTENELKEREVEDTFLLGYCDAVIKSFCYHEWEDDEGNKLLSVYPYKDFALLESIQEEHDALEQFREESSLVMRVAAFAFTDQQAVQVPTLYPLWSDLPDCTTLTTQEEAVKGTEITRVRGEDGKLYKVIKTHAKQSDWAPGQTTASLFTVIDVEHAGTMEDPIPATVNMEYFKGKYYIEDGTLYRCTRDSGTALQYLPSQLVGHYFEIVEV